MTSEHPSILVELRRRKVYRVVVVYAGVAFGLLQLADIAFPRIGLPDWSVTLVLALAVLGFPAAIGLAWAFDWTSEGIRRTPSSGAGFSAPTSALRILEFALILGLVAAVGYLYATRLSGARTPAVSDLAPPQGERSIAVLPFVNMSHDPENEYFSDGVAEEILDALANLGRLRVAARTSSFTFKDQNRDVREIAEKLSVETVLEGSVRKAGNRVRITAQLIDASTGFHLWSKTFDRELTDIFAVQEEISRSIVDALHVPLGLGAAERLVHAGTSNLEAYNLYLRGLHHFGQLGLENYRKTIEIMEEAIAIDPEFAKPYGVIASAHMINALWLPEEQVLSKAKRAFDRALELDPGLAVALVAKGQYLTVTEWDWLGARASFEKALKDRSDLTMATFGYTALHLVPLGLGEEAEALLERAEAGDPLDTRLRIIHGTLLLLTGRSEEALAQLEHAIDIDEENAAVSAALCSARVATGDFEGAQAIIAGWRERLGHDHTWLLACKTYVKLATLDLNGTMDAYDELLAAASTERGLNTFAGDVSLALGHVDEAMDWYLKSIEGGELPMLMTRLRHADEPALQENARYQALLKRMRLDEESRAEMGLPPISAALGVSVGG